MKEISDLWQLKNGVCLNEKINFNVVSSAGGCNVFGGELQRSDCGAGYWR